MILQPKKKLLRCQAASFNFIHFFIARILKMLPANENIAEKCHAHTLQCVTAKRIKRRQTTCRTAFRSVKMVFSHFLFPLYKVVSLSSITSRKCIVCSTAEHVSNGYNHSSNVCGFFSLARGKCFNLKFPKRNCGKICV